LWVMILKPELEELYYDEAAHQYYG
jgi:hypothetical protein